MGKKGMFGAIIGTLTGGILAGQAGYQIGNSMDQKDLADKQAEAQKDQLRLQQRVKEAQNRRASRVQTAQVKAASGVMGVGGSVIDTPVAGINTALETQTDLLNSQTSLQVQQVNLSNDMTQNQLNSQIAATIGDFTKTALTLGMNGGGGGE